ncbi:MAG TPA: DUF302 domain-containing protein [Chitinophagaceae bacterium]
MIKDFHLSKRLHVPFSDALEKVTAALKQQGFGIITTIDLKSTFREKLNKDFRNYVILGACNPGYAFGAIQEDDKIGVYLPCNVVVQEHSDGSVEVSAINPEEMVQGSDNTNLRSFATEVKSGLLAALNQI